VKIIRLKPKINSWSSRQGEVFTFEATLQNLESGEVEEAEIHLSVGDVFTLDALASQMATHASVMESK